MVDVPADFHQNWLMMVFPVGKHCLVIASKGYIHNSALVDWNFRETLSLQFAWWKYDVAKSYSILDCIHHEILQTFFVLDLMCWNSHPVYNSDTEFRQYWLQVKLSDRRCKVFFLLAAYDYRCPGWKPVGV